MRSTFYLRLCTDMALSNNRPRYARLGHVTCRWLAGVCVLTGLGLAANSALGEPTGGEVLDGSATITREGTHTLIETGSRRTRIGWNGFDIATDESVHAQQPDANSVLINDVSDASYTTIDGSLSSNGAIWILNPAGVYFGGSAIVEVAGLVAAAGELSNQSFVMGMQHFTNLRGEVRNDGQILTDGGDVALIGRRVANHGQIVTRGGDLVMASGDSVFVFRHDTHIQVHLPDLDTNPNVENSGTIDTAGGRARLAAGDFLGLAIRNTGEIHASQIAVEAGAESIIEISGTLDASDENPGQPGGHIEVTGDWVIIEDAVLDASGTAGGGEIWIGGEAAGAGTLATARGTFVGDDVEIHADALHHGDGGQIVIWSDEMARVQGLLSAEGGRFGGDGGFIETSSRGRIDVAADIRVGAARGQPGTWLLDPVNVAIVSQMELDAALLAAGPDDVIELLEVDDTTDTIRFQPQEPPPALPGESLVSADTLVSTLQRGGTVVISTQSLNASEPGEDLGTIQVRQEVVIPDGAAIQPNTVSELQLVATDDIHLQQRIASLDEDLELSVTMQANDNPVLFGLQGQPEPSEQERFGDVIIDADIITQGGDILASGTNISLNADLDTRRLNPSSDDPGGRVSFFGIDVADAGLIDGPPDAADEFGNITVAAASQITTGGGTFFSNGELFSLAEGAVIDVFLPATLPADGDPNLGAAQVFHSDTVEIEGDIHAETLVLSAATRGEGDLIIGGAATGTVLSATTLRLTAGDGTATGGSNVDAEVLIDPTVSFQGGGQEGSPESFTFTQDAAIREAHIPDAGQFANGVSGLFLALTTSDGFQGTEEADIELGMIPAKFEDAELVLVAPDSIDLTDEINPRNVALAIGGDFTVDTTLAANLRPIDNTLDTEDDGVVQIQAGRDGTGSLFFETGATLVADHIALQAGSPSSSGTESIVDPTGASFAAGESFELRQDADISDDNIPEESQFIGGIAGLDYSLLSEGGSITIADATRVTGTALSLIALETIEIEGGETPAPIVVERADFGGFAGFQVTQELLDAFEIAPAGGGKSILTLRSGSGTLRFESISEENTAVQVQVEADRIHLVGSSIDVTTGRPLFQSDPSTSPERLVFEQDGLIASSILPTEENFPDGLGPSELFVLQSNAVGVGLLQGAPQVLPGEDFRGWSFPVQPTTRVILAGPGISLERNDGFDLVLDQRDDLWGTSVSLLAAFEPQSDHDGNPISDAVIDASRVNSIRGFESGIDFLTPDVSNIQMPRDEDGIAISASSLALQQEGDFNLRSGFALPDLSGMLPLEFQPGTYSLTSRLGSIEIHNSFLSATNLILRVDSLEDEYIGFDRDNEGGVLTVKSLTAQMGGDFEVGGPEGAEVVADDTIALGSGLLGAGSLSFGSDVRLTAETVALTAGLNPGTNPNAEVDARTNAPVFNVQHFGILQTGDLRNGLSTAEGEALSTLPVPIGQFLSTPLDSYTLATVFGDIEINDPSEVLIARNVELFAGSQSAPATLTLRADVGAPSGPMGTCQTACGTATDPNLVLIGGDSAAEAVLLTAAEILLEAPDGYVDVGDERVRFDLQDGGRFAIRQGDPIDNATRLPHNFQFLGNLEITAIELQSLQDVGVSASVAERLEETHLILRAGLSEDAFDAAETGRRLEDPVPDLDPDIPDHVYDRMADSNGDGVVDGADDGAITDKDVTIHDTSQFDLALHSLTIESGEDGSINLGNVHIMTEANQVYGNVVQLLGDTELTARSGLLSPILPTMTAPASTIIFEKKIDGATAGGQSLSVNATERIHFMDEIGTVTRLGTLTVNLEQLIQLEERPPTPRVEFGTEEFTGTFHVKADNVLLNPESGDPGSQYVRARVPDAATFFRRGGSLEFVVGTTGSPGTFSMGANEKLSVDGSELRIDAADGTVTIGDLSALDRIQVIAQDIHILRREAGSVLQANGRTRNDPGVDFVARDIDFQFAFDASSDPTGSTTLYQNQLGAGRDARFGVENPIDAPGFVDEFSVLSLQFNQLTGEGLGFGGADLPIDGVPDGISRIELARSYAPERPDVPIAAPVVRRIRKPGDLAVVGIELRELTALELQSAARSGAIYQNLDSVMPDRDGVASISEPRLVAHEVEQTARLYERVFGSNGSRATQVRSTLQTVVDDYKRSTGAQRVVGFELRRYVYNRPSSQFNAYQELQSLDALFRHHRRSGLTPTEYGPIQYGWLEDVLPTGISVRELSEFVHPSRYVRGSDVLDVFGD